MSLFFITHQGICLEGSAAAVIEPLDDMIYEDEFTEIEENTFRWTRRIFLEHGEGQDFETLHMAVRIPGPVNYYMIPGVNYNGNAWGKGKEPKGLLYNEKPWVFASHRSSVPAGVYCQNDQIALGMWADPSCDLSASCSLTKQRSGEMTAWLKFPEQESPVVYCARDTYEDSVYTESHRGNNGVICLKAVLVLGVRSNVYDYAGYLRKAWNYFKRDISPVLDKQAVWKLGFSFIKNSAYFEENGFCGFCMGLTWENGAWRQKRDYLEIGWVGQNASLAVSLIYKALIDKTPEDLSLGLGILDGWAREGGLPGGLFRCRFDRIQQFGSNVDNREERHDAANLYSVVEEYLDAFHVLKLAGIYRDEYRNLVLNLCDFMLTAQQEDGSIGKAWYNDGTCSDREGTIGCYLCSALCSAYVETKKKEYLDAAKKGMDYYYQEFMMNGYSTAGALDTCCVDKESAVPLLETALRLYELEGKESDLERAVTVSDYLATWQYHYDVAFPDNSILKQLGYRSRGGTAVSVQHHHMDCYGLVLYEAWMKLGRLTGDSMWMERALSVWNNSLYNISDGSTVIKGQKRPAGAQDEGFLQTRWHTKKGEYFGVSEWLVVWNHAFRLKILRKEFLAKRVGFGKEEKNIW